jgi:hypothetical protein
MLLADLVGKCVWHFLLRILPASRDELHSQMNGSGCQGQARLAWTARGAPNPLMECHTSSLGQWTLADWRNRDGRMVGQREGCSPSDHSCTRGFYSTLSSLTHSRLRTEPFRLPRSSSTPTDLRVDPEERIFRLFEKPFEQHLVDHKV